VGVERIAEEVSLRFPGARAQVITRDEMKSESEIKKILHRIHSNEIDIIIGTQIITKGYHFPRLTLVGIIDADIGLGAGDLRASEKIFQLLHQVSGRAGRESLKGKVYIQTYRPNSQLINKLRENKFDEFIQEELDSREVNGMPPFTRMASVLLTGKNDTNVMLLAKQLVKNAIPVNGVKILGPAPAMFSKIQNRFRWRVLFIVNRNIDIQRYISNTLINIKIPSTINLKIDFDPYSFN
jgi:primosomal protein N' (replication factor Y)